MLWRFLVGLLGVIAGFHSSNVMASSCGVQFAPEISQFGFIDSADSILWVQALEPQRLKPEQFKREALSWTGGQSHMRFRVLEVLKSKQPISDVDKLGLLKLSLPMPLLRNDDFDQHSSPLFWAETKNEWKDLEIICAGAVPHRFPRTTAMSRLAEMMYSPLDNKPRDEAFGKIPSNMAVGARYLLIGYPSSNPRASEIVRSTDDEWYQFVKARIANPFHVRD